MSRVIDLDQQPDWTATVRVGGAEVTVNLYELQQRLLDCQAKLPPGVSTLDRYTAYQNELAAVGVVLTRPEQVNAFLTLFNEQVKELEKKAESATAPPAASRGSTESTPSDCPPTASSGSTPTSDP